MFRKKYFIGLLILIGSVQVAKSQEIQIGGGGFTTITPNNGDFINKDDNGYIFDVGYNYYLSDHWSIGLGVSYLQGRFAYQELDIKDAYPVIDIEKDALEFRYHADRYFESAKWHSLGIPLTIQYETLGDIRWYFRTGIVPSFVLGKSTAQMQWEGLQTSGYYEQWDAELTGPKFAGFGDWGKVEKEQKVQFKNSYSWTIETGIKGAINRHFLYFGLFANIGLNDMRPEEKQNEHEIAYLGTENEPLKYHNVWAQKRFQNKKLRNVQVGVSVKYGISWK